MKTPEEFEPLGYWMGWHLSAREGYATGEWTQGYWWTDGTRWIAAKEDKTSLTDAEACEVIAKLKEQGLAGNLTFSYVGYSLQFGCSMANPFMPTISAAVEEALLKLIAAEKQTQCCTK